MDWGLTSTVSKAANKSRRIQVTSPRSISSMRTLRILRRVHIHLEKNVSESCISRDRKEFVEVKECTAGCQMCTNDTVYIREFFEIIEPRGVVSRVKKTSSERWDTLQERVENAEMESLIETLRTRWEICEDQLSEIPSKPNQLWRRMIEKNGMIYGIKGCK